MNDTKVYHKYNVKVAEMPNYIYVNPIVFQITPLQVLRSRNITSKGSVHCLLMSCLFLCITLKPNLL